MSSAATFTSFALALSSLALGACATGGGAQLGGGNVERRVAQQLALAKARFSPGEIDGRDGVLTRRAAEHYLAQRPGQPEVPADPAPFTTYTVTKNDAKFVGELGSTKEEQAKQKYLPYESMLELVAERYHCAPGLITELNGLPANATVRPGDTLRVPNVEPLEIASVGRGIRGGSKSNKVHIRPDLGSLEVTGPNGRLLAYFPVSCGDTGTPTPKGDWKIVNLVTLPSFRWDDEMLNRGTRSSDFTMFPPGPNNPVGVVWAGTSKSGVGIHGNPLPHTILQGRSHGCIRLTNWDALELGKLIAVGSPVVID